MALPKILIVREVKENDGTTWLDAGRNVEEAMGGHDGPIVVGTYKLFNKRTLVKTIRATKETKVKQ